MKINNKKLRWSWIVFYPILLRLLMIALTFPYIFVYSALVNTGQSPGYYEQYVFENRAWISTLLGLPVFFYACYFMAIQIKFDPIRNCIYMVMMYIVMDIPMELALGDLSDWRLIIAHTSKLLAGYIGVVLAKQKNETNLKSKQL